MSIAAVKSVIRRRDSSTLSRGDVSAHPFPGISSSLIAGDGRRDSSTLSRGDVSAHQVGRLILQEENHRARAREETEYSSASTGSCLPATSEGATVETTFRGHAVGDHSKVSLLGVCDVLEDFYGKPPPFFLYEERSGSVFSLIQRVEQHFDPSTLVERPQLVERLESFLTTTGLTHLQHKLGVLRTEFDSMFSACHESRQCRDRRKRNHDDGVVKGPDYWTKSLLLLVAAVMNRQIKNVVMFTSTEARVWRLEEGSVTICDRRSKEWAEEEMETAGLLDPEQNSNFLSTVYYYCDVDALIWMKPNRPCAARFNSDTHKIEASPCKDDQDTTHNPIVSMGPFDSIVYPAKPQIEESPIRNDQGTIDNPIVSMGPFDSILYPAKPPGIAYMSEASMSTDDSGIKHIPTVSCGLLDSVVHPTKPPAAVKRWFIANLAPKGIDFGAFVGITSEVLQSVTAVDKCFSDMWKQYTPRYYNTVGCWLPDLTYFRRRNGDVSAEHTELLHNENQWQLLMLSFGYVTDCHPISLASFRLQIKDMASRFFIKYRFVEPNLANPNGSWWPSVLEPNVVDLVNSMNKAKTAIQLWETEIASSRTNKQPLDSMQSIVYNTFKVMGKFLGLYYNTGASIYAEPTLPSALKINTALSDAFDEEFVLAITKQAVLFVDLGAGTSTFVSSLARPRNCPVLGLEYCKTRSLLALGCLLEANASTKRYPFKVAYIPMNIFDLKSLQPPPEIEKMVVYLGDEAFHEGLMDRIASLLKNVSVEVILISGKAGRHKEFATYWESKGGFSRLVDVGWSKRGGNNEHGTLSIFRLKPSKDCQPPMDPRVSAALQACGNGASLDSRLRYYKQTIDAIENGSYPLELYGVGLTRRLKKQKTQE